MVLCGMASMVHANGCGPAPDELRTHGGVTYAKLQPEQFTVRWYTTQSNEPIILQVTHSWSPIGVDRFFQLIKDDYYQCNGFFRVVDSFVVQFGIAAVPTETSKWNTVIKDDPVIKSNTYGMVSFATAGPNTRTTQIFINTANNSQLDDMGFAPFAVVVSGMDIVEKMYNPTPNDSNGIDQDLYTEKGNVWLLQNYPDTTLIYSNQTYHIF